MTFANFGDNLLAFLKHPFSHTPASICSNTTTAQSYLSQTLALINKLQANSSYNSVLQLQSANFVSYLENKTNQALLSTNCTAFVISLKAAKTADEIAEHKQQQIASYIEHQFEQVARNTTGSNNPDGIENGEGKKHRF